VSSVRPAAVHETKIAPDLDRSLEPVTDPLASIDEAAGLLSASADCEVRKIGRWVSSLPPGLLEHLGFENAPGRSARLEVRLARRDELLRGLKLPAGRLAADLGKYRSSAWARDRLKVDCPYPQQDRRATFYRILRLVDRDLSRRQVARILGHRPPC
jgi:hypothetical protein